MGETLHRKLTYSTATPPGKNIASSFNLQTVQVKRHSLDTRLTPETLFHVAQQPLQVGTLLCYLVF